MLERIKVESGHAQAVRDQVERDFCVSLIGNCNVDLINKITTQYIKFRDGEDRNPWVDPIEPNPNREMTK